MLAITEKEFKQLADLINNKCGIHLKEEKKSLVAGRLHNELIDHNIKTFSEYYEILINDKGGQAITTFINKITTNHTYFMREANHFYFFRDHILPYLTSKCKSKDLRVWCAACSTGEEAYTLAMLIEDFFVSEKVLWDTKVLATDISQKVLEIAQLGIYGEEKIIPLPNIWKIKYFVKENDAYRVKEELKNQVIYRKFNLMENNFPFKKKFHTIFCRNVMIYFNDETKLALVQKLYHALEYGGYLFIGHSESIPGGQTEFTYVMPSVYRKM